MHGGFAVEEVAVKQKVASHACIDSLPGVSPIKNLLPFSGVAQTWTEDAHTMLAIVDLDAHHTLLGVRQQTAHALAFVAANTIQSLFHGQASILQFLALGLKTSVDHVRTLPFCGQTQYILPHSVYTTALMRSSQNTRSGYRRTAHPSTFASFLMNGVTPLSCNCRSI